MKIFICASKYNYHLIPPIKEELEKQGHIITPPNCFDDPMLEERLKIQSAEEHVEFKSAMLKKQEEKIIENDAILVMNYEKNGKANYLGGATFLEIFQAWNLGKPVYLMNPIPDCIFTDELKGMNPTIINEDLTKIGQ